MKDWTELFSRRIRATYTAILKEAPWISHETAMELTKRWAITPKMRRSATQQVDFDCSLRWFEEERLESLEKWKKLSESRGYPKELRDLRTRVLIRRNSAPPHKRSTFEPFAED